MIANKLLSLKNFGNYRKHRRPEPFFKNYASYRLRAVIDESGRRFSSSANVAGNWGAQDDDFATLAYSTNNIGDEIQTIAQLGFIPQGRKLSVANRDHLNSFAGKSSYLIANGWYLHNTKNWPPSNRLKPIFVSFHLADSWKPDVHSVNYLRQHAPIGCRDLTTANRLKALGVDAHFSGCLTLTIENPYPPESRTDQIVFCDADRGYDGGYPPSASSLVRRLIPKSILKSAVHIEQECSDRHQLDYAWKMSRALSQLELLAKARLVVTTRLHCALPCRALGTPVIFLHQNYETDSRFDGLREALVGYGPSSKQCQLNFDDPQIVDIEKYRSLATESVASAIRRVIPKISD